MPVFSTCLTGPASHKLAFKLFAIILIAAPAVFQRAEAQNSPSLPANAPSQDAQDAAFDANQRAERDRLAREGAQASQAYSDAQKACYQKFQVNACLTEARNAHNAAQADLKRQEIALNDMQRKRKAVLQQQRTEEKTSPQRQQELAEKRGTAMENDAQRKQREAGRRPPAEGASAKAPNPTPRTAPQAKPSTQAEQLARQREKAADQQTRVARAAQAKARTEQKRKDAEQRKAEAQKRLQSKNKPPAADLPIPGN